MWGRDGRRDSKLGGSEMRGNGGFESVAVAMGWYRAAKREGKDFVVWKVLLIRDWIEDEGRNVVWMTLA